MVGQEMEVGGGGGCEVSRGCVHGSCPFLHHSMSLGMCIYFLLFKNNNNNKVIRDNLTRDECIGCNGFRAMFIHVSFTFKIDKILHRCRCGGVLLT